jgi:predicted CDP-diglyceride synthetase/phosphatidate cytidylyltransferase
MRNKVNKDIYQYALATLIVIVVFVLTYVVFIVPLPEENKDIALLLIGVLVAKFSDVVAYFFNSTKGSAEKTDIISRLPAITE